MNFSNLKKQSNSFDNLLKQVEKLNSPTYEKDDTADLYWKPTSDKAGNALAVIRFLPGPAVDGDDALPWVQYWDHAFQNDETGKWYIEKSLTTLGQKDPVSEFNAQLWKQSSDDNSWQRKHARIQKRRLHYVSNIYVVSDSKNPDAEGKVFLFKYGKKIFDKLTKMMNPDLESEQAINPFDLWQGAHFKLKVTRQNVKIGSRTVAMPNYDEAVFLAPGPLFKDDEQLEAVWKSEHSLKEIIDQKNFKTYEQLKKRLDDVVGLTEEQPVERHVADDSEDVPFTDSTPAKTSSKATKKAPPPVTEEEDDDPDLAEFRKFALSDD